MQKQDILITFGLSDYWWYKYFNYKHLIPANDDQFIPVKAGTKVFIINANHPIASPDSL